MPRGVRVGKDPWQREIASFTCSCSIWPWKCGWDGSSCAQGQGAGLRVLVSRGGVWVMPERSSTAPCWAVGWDGAALGVNLGGFALCCQRAAAEGFGGVGMGNGQANSHHSETIGSRFW